MKSDMVTPLRLQMVVQKLKVNFNTPELGIGEGPVACMHACMHDEENPWYVYNTLRCRLRHET